MMPNMVFRGKVLSKHSAFEAIAQFAIEKYYLVPYPNHSDKRPSGINRYFHGGSHVASVVNNLEICLGLYETYAPALLQKDGKPISETEIKLLKLAAIYHDVANIDEYHGKPEEHALIFRKDMIALGFDEAMVTEIAEAMALKDGPQTTHKKILSPTEKTEQLKHKNIYQKLLQSADCLDVIRVVRGLFDDTQLDIYHDLNTYPGFLDELNALKKKHAIFLDQFNITHNSASSVHTLCEFSANCYLTIKNFYKAFDPEKDADALVKTIMLEVENAETLEAYQEGIFVRMTDDVNVDLEISQANTKILASHQLDDEKLKSYLLDQEENYQQVYAPAEFKWRPATLIKANCPIPLYGHKSENQRAFVIILPHHPETHATFFYKANILSNSAKTGYFAYNRTIYNKAKDKKNVAVLSSKLDEINARRQGFLPDPGLHYYGKSEIDLGEVLLAGYQHISGIGVLGFNASSAQSALKTAASIQPKVVNFYRYIPHEGLQIISIEEVKAQAKGKIGNSTHKLSEQLIEIERLVAAKKESIKNVQKISKENEPLKFMFEIDGQVFSTYMVNGRAMLAFQLDGIPEIVPTQLIPYVAKQFYKEQCDKLKPIIQPSIKAHFELTTKSKTLFSVRIQSELLSSDFSHSKLLELLKPFGKFTIPTVNGNNELVLHSANLDLITKLQEPNEMSHLIKIISNYIRLQDFEIPSPPKEKRIGSKYPRPTVNNNNNSTTSTKLAIKELKEEKTTMDHVKTPVKRDVGHSNDSVLEQHELEEYQDRDSKAAKLFDETSAVANFKMLSGSFSMFSTQKNHMTMELAEVPEKNICMTSASALMEGEIDHSEAEDSLRVCYRELPANYYRIFKKQDKTFYISFISNSSLDIKQPKVTTTFFIDTPLTVALEQIKSKYNIQTLIPFYLQQAKYTPVPLL